MPSVEGRTLKISPNLSKIWRQYKEKIKVSNILSSRLKEEKIKVKILLESINEVVCL